MFFAFLTFSNAQNAMQLQLIDSVQTLRKLSSNENQSASQQLSNIKLALKISNELGIDSTLLKTNRALSSLYLRQEKYSLYRKTNFKNLELASKLKDSSSIAIAYRNLAWFHFVESNNDSSYYYYYRARGLHRQLGQIKDEGEVLLNMADIQETERDYVGSENNAIEAIKLIQTLPQDDNNLDTLWTLHNLLGIISENFNNHDKALEYYQKALSYSNKMSDGYINKLFALNNIAIVYRELDNFDTALKFHNDLLETQNLKQRSPETYALYLNNYAYTKFLSGDYKGDELLRLFWKSNKMCDSLKYDFGSMTVSSNLSDYYLSKSKIDSSLHYGKITYQLAKNSNSNDMLLETLLSLSKLEEGEKGKEHLNSYIKLSDSLLSNERANRNKFALIEFETDQIKAENVQITKERLIFLMSSVGLLLTLILLYIIISQRAKNKELEFNKIQQEANEEIYNLMLAQQDKVDEGRTQEKKRISEDLHDGILGRLFGTRLSLDSLNFTHTDEAVKTRGQYIDELKSIEQEIRKISHDLNTDFVSGSSFSDIIIALVETQTQAFQLRYDYHEDDDIDWDELSNKTKIHIYRMLQETMQNIYKHADANHIKISFQLKNSVILLTVEDDGSGFNTNKARKGIGLKNFDSRASEVGGKVEIFSKIGKGTKVIIHIPTE